MKKSQFANSVLCLIVFAALVLGLSFVAKAPDVVALLNPAPQVAEVVKRYGQEVLLSSAVIRSNQVTHQTRARFSLANRGSNTVRNLTIICALKDREGNFWGRQQWRIYEAIEPGDQRDFEINDRRYLSHHARLDNSSCFLQDFKRLGEKKLAATEP